MVNLSDGPSRLTFARVGLDGLRTARPRQFDAAAVAAAVACEASLGYFAPSGRYWETPDAYDAAKIDALTVDLAAAELEGHLRQKAVDGRRRERARAALA